MPSREIRVLIIEDDEDDFFILKNQLQEVAGQAFAVDWASSYEVGTQKLFSTDGKGYSVCLVDYRLGARTGIDLIKECVAKDLSVPLILLTGFGQHDIDLEAMRVGAADYLVKDQITGFLLEKTIRYAIHRSENLSQLKQRETQILMQDRLASIGLLASSLAHEIGTPLGVIRGRAEYVSSLHQDADLKKNMDVIVSQIDRISKLIHSLLNLARGDQIKKTGELQIAQVTHDVLDLMAHEFKKNSIQVKNEVGETLTLRAAGGAESLHQVLLNLIVNSLHAIQSAIQAGRVKDHQIRIFIQEKDDFIGVGVQDTGCGISKENLRNLFKPFFTTKDIGSGTGLGLATSYRIVESWGGRIEVSSEENVGTTFIVFLPRGVQK